MTTPRQHSALQALSHSAFKQQPVSCSVFALGTGTEAAHLAAVLTCRQGGNNLALHYAGGDTRQVVLFQEGKWELLPVSPSPPLHEAPACAQHGAFALHCGTASTALSLLRSAVPRSSRQKLKQAAKGSSQAARSARKFIRDIRHAEVWTLQELV